MFEFELNLNKTPRNENRIGMPDFSDNLDIGKP